MFFCMDLLRTGRCYTTPRQLKTLKIKPFLVFISFVFSVPSLYAQSLDTQLFDPIANPFGVFSSQSSRSLQPFSFFSQLSTHYTKDELVRTDRTSILDRPIAHRMTTELSLGIGLFEWFELSASLPFYIAQLSQNSSGQFSPVESGFGTFRTSLKGTILKNQKAGGFGIALAVDANLPFGQDTSYMQSHAFSIRPSILIDFQMNGFLLVANIGYRFLEQKQIDNLLLGDEVTLSFGAEIPFFFKGLSAVAELNALVSVRQIREEFNQPSYIHAPVEGLIGLRWRRKNLILSGGSGLGVTGGFGAPEVRVSFQIGYLFGETTPFVEEKLPSNSQKEMPLSMTNQPSGTEKSSSKRVAAKDGIQNPTPKDETLDQKEEVDETPPKLEPVTLEALQSVAEEDPDVDGDGIPNIVDRCKDKAEDVDKFQDEDGCPDLDNDRDGIADEMDKCPLQPETVNGVKDNDGCPDQGKSKIVLSKRKVKISDKIFFDSGSDQLKPVSHDILKQLASFLKAQWQVRLVRVDGHTDAQGNLDMNVDLSERRARRVLSFLKQYGVNDLRLKAKGYGSKKPVQTNKTSSGRAKNRRVEFTILKIHIPTKQAPQKEISK